MVRKWETTGRVQLNKDYACSWGYQKHDGHLMGGVRGNGGSRRHDSLAIRAVNKRKG